MVNDKSIHQFLKIILRLPLLYFLENVVYEQIVEHSRRLWKKNPRGSRKQIIQLHSEGISYRKISTQVTYHTLLSIIRS